MGPGRLRALELYQKSQIRKAESKAIEHARRCLAQIIVLCLLYSNDLERGPRMARWERIAKLRLRYLRGRPPAARWSKMMPIEFLLGRPLSPEELEMLRPNLAPFGQRRCTDYRRCTAYIQTPCPASALSQSADKPGSTHVPQGTSHEPRRGRTRPIRTPPCGTSSRR